MPQDQGISSREDELRGAGFEAAGHVAEDGDEAREWPVGGSTGSRCNDIIHNDTR